MAKQKRHQFKAKPKPCAYCGAASSTRDHVIPEGIFNVLDTQMITVRACFACNQAKKRYDDILRDFLAVDVRTSGHPVAESKFWGEFRRAVQRRQSELSHRISHESRVELRRSSADLYHEPVVTADADAELDASMSYIVRGLTTHHLREIVDPNADIRVGLLEVDRAEHIWAMMTAHGGINGPYQLGGDICIWAYQYHDANHSIWLICFYGRLFFLVTVQPARPAVITARRHAMRERSMCLTSELALERAAHGVGSLQSQPSTGWLGLLNDLPTL